MGTGCDSEPNGSEEATAEHPAALPEEGAEKPEDEPRRPGPEVNPLDLPPKLAGLLRREMIELDTGMHTLHSALVRGDGERAAETAQKIHDSFILKRELSKEELKTLVSQLPKDFVKRDRALHETSAELAEAARQDDFETAAERYGEMTRACVGCHSAHAAERFPGMAP